MNIRPTVKVCLRTEEKFFGPGVCELLELIHQTGSLQEACTHMGLSYSKGRRIVKQMENQLGYPVVKRWAGGSGGGGSVVTEQGLEFVENYKKMVEDIEGYMNLSFQKFFGEGTV